MARLFIALQILLCLLPQTQATTIMDASGVINQRASPLNASSKGVIALISSPGDMDSFSSPSSSSKSVEADMDDASGCIIVRSPGATLGSSSNAAAAASSIAGAVVVTGVIPSDCEGIGGIAETRHGKTLYSIFSSKLNSDESLEKALLMVAVEGTLEEDESVVQDIAAIFKSCAMSVSGKEDIVLEDLFEVQIVSVTSQDDAAMVMSTAVAAGVRSPLSQTSENVVSAITQAYSTTTSSTDTTTSTLLCDDSYTRHSRSSRAKLSAWKRRADRSLLIDQFGPQATALLQNTLDGYDKDTFFLSGDSDTALAKHRLELRSTLKDRIETQLRELFALQLAILEKSTLKKLNSKLLSQLQSSGKKSPEVELQENASAVRTAEFAFESTITDLELPILSITKEKYIQAMSAKLNDALVAFPDSPPAVVKNMKQVQSMASRDKKPTERSLDAGLSLVAMIRPDGFGNLQGFAGYSMGANSVTVGVHNDADAPETISQFGGSRPPFLRVQPKLNLDIEL